MAMVSLQEAAKLAGVGRTTLYRKADQGLLSTRKMADGSRKVDTSELFRVFPQDSPIMATVEHDGTAADTLKREIEHLKELLLHKDQIIEMKNQVIETQALALRMLEYKPQLPPEKKAHVPLLTRRKIPS